MIGRLLLILVIGLSYTLSAVAEPTQILLKASIVRILKSEGREVRRSVRPVLMIADGDTALLTLTPRGSGDFELQTRFKPNAREGSKFRLELFIQSRLQEGPWQKSKVSATLLEGEPWDATVEDPSAQNLLEYRVTLWKIPPGLKFVSFDDTGKPRFEKR